MKVNLIAAFAAILFWTFSGAMAQDSGELTIPFSDPGKRGKVKIDIKKGSIEVRGTDRRDVLVRYSAMDKSRNGNGNTNQDGLRRISSGAMDLEASERNNFIEIESDSWNKGVNLVVEVPAGVDLDLATYNSGDIRIFDIKGEIVADNYNGAISAENISGSLVADSYNGTIKATFSEVTPDTPMAFTTYNGHVDLTLPASFKASMKMNTKQGDILSGFDFAVKKTEPVTKTEKQSSTYKVYLDDWVRGDINGGGPEVMIKNYNGNIYLRKN